MSHGHVTLNGSHKKCDSNEFALVHVRMCAWAKRVRGCDLRMCPNLDLRVCVSACLRMCVRACACACDSVPRLARRSRTKPVVVSPLQGLRKVPPNTSCDKPSCTTRKHLFRRVVVESNASQGDWIQQYYPTRSVDQRGKVGKFIPSRCRRQRQQQKKLGAPVPEASHPVPKGQTRLRAVRFLRHSLHDIQQGQS